MKYTIAVCDDVRKDAETMAAIADKWAEREGVRADIQIFPSAESFLFQYDQVKTYDILLLDVEMREMSGIELAKRIRWEGGGAEIIFVTSHFEFSGEGYEVDALHYLIKPIAEKKLMEVLSRAANRLAAEPASVIISAGSETVKLYEPDILYVESFLHYITIHTKRGEFKIKENISTFAQKLSADFYRTHRSYLASLKHIIRISRTAVTMDDGSELPLARGKYDEINRAFIERN